MSKRSRASLVFISKCKLPRLSDLTDSIPFSKPNCAMPVFKKNVATVMRQYIRPPRAYASSIVIHSSTVSVLYTYKIAIVTRFTTNFFFCPFLELSHSALRSPAQLTQVTQCTMISTSHFIFTANCSSRLWLKCMHGPSTV